MLLLSLFPSHDHQGWSVTQIISCAGEKTQEDVLRGLRQSEAVTRPSHRRGLDEQRQEQHPDSMRILSSILAFHAQKAWGEAFDRNAADVHPLIVGAKNRVGRLRAYGNAIVAPQAEAFIRAYLDD